MQVQEQSSLLLLCAHIQVGVEMCRLLLCSKVKPNLIQSKTNEVTERMVPKFITVHLSKTKLIWSSVIPKFRIHQCLLIHLRLLSILFSCMGQWVPLANVAQSLFIFPCQLTSANICWEWFLCPPEEQSFLPSFSPTATVQNLKDTNHTRKVLGSCDSCGRGFSVFSLLQEQTELQQV